MRKVVLVGRDGQVARALQARLTAPTCDLTVLARPDFDLSNPAPLAARIVELAPDIVINPAAYTAVDKAEDEPAAAHAVNATAAAAIAAAAALAGAPIIHFSTDYVFDGSKRTPYVETDPVAPLGVYGASKLAGERAIAAANPRHIILRTAWVCSPDGSNFVKTMLRFGAERPVLRVVDDQRGSPTFAADLAAAVETIVQRLSDIPSAGDPDGLFGVFHVSSRGETTWCAFARAIMAGAIARGRAPMASVEAITTADYPTKARRPAYSMLSSAKIEAVYGVHMPSWDLSLAPCLDRLVGPVVNQTTQSQRTS